MSGFPEFPATEGGSFQPHSEGAHLMVCVDALYLGEKVERYKDEAPKLSPKCVLVFASGETNDDGHLITVSKEMTYSMGEKAALRAFLSQWRGKGYKSEDEARAVKLDRMIHHPGIVTVEHKVSGKGRTYALIRAISPLMKGQQAPAITGYTRPDFWTKRIEEYRTAAEAFRAEQAKHAPYRPAQDLEFERDVFGEDDELPFDSRGGATMHASPLRGHNNQWSM